MTASPLSPAYRQAESEIAAEDAVIDMAPVEILEDVLSDLMGGVVIDPHRQSDPLFRGDQSRQRHWDALADDMKNPCPEDRL